MLIKVFSYALQGIDPIKITVEVKVTPGIKFFLVGLPDNAIKESQQRIFSAIEHINYKIPGKKIIINMAPADIKKEGSSYDLTIAIGILLSSEQIKYTAIKDYIVMGELSLDGSLNPIKGVLPIVLKAKADGFKGIILPKANAKEAAIVEGIHVYGAHNLQEVVDFLNQVRPIQKEQNEPFIVSKHTLSHLSLDFKDVKGQAKMKRAFEIAAAGGHNLIMIGPPGAGKTMLAKRFSSILPPLNVQQAIETTVIHSVTGKIAHQESIIKTHPFRAPHHTISEAALVGGGSYPEPGEISLAHNGVLFLDELPEFSRSALEVLRQPLEEKTITVSRAKMSVNFPANFLLIAAMNPCPCGYFNHPSKECVCSVSAVKKYLNKISGPLLERIDLHVEVVPLPFEHINSEKKELDSAHYFRNVEQARKIQNNRLPNKSNSLNATLSTQEVKAFCNIDKDSISLLKTAMEKLSLSVRAYDKILKIARTIADLEQKPSILVHHIAEAIQYRSLDKNAWF